MFKLQNLMKRGWGEGLEPWLGARESFFPLYKLIFSYTVWLVYKEEETCTDGLHCVKEGRRVCMKWPCAAEPPQQVSE